ncbi:AI-2E family transporter [Intrasporangium sp. YIM S08009]|uniref:AI-2E family transporter n=1 Tax=Intrasporangium zincisolvens TaxID=3080018 RepID=UPI002B060F58|nr:AI-2E family transporter [Intrasporangium sp. YIM S08009]
MPGHVDPPPETPSPPARDAQHVVVHLDRRNVWRAGWVLVAIVAFAAFGRWVLEDGGSVIFTLVMSMLAAIAMEPAVARLSRRMRRGAATAVVMGATLLAIVVFLLAFGQLLADQLATLVRSIPSIVERATTWANEHLDTHLDAQTVLAELSSGTSALATVATGLAGGIVGAVAAVVGAAFSSMTFAFFTFYFSADQPRMRRWVARLVPPRQQEVMSTAWQLAVIKAGGYVSARLVLAAICGGLSALFMFIIGMPYWLALGIWTGLVAQFVPTIGTYIAIALPVFVGLVGEQPWQGVAMLAFALVYQQIENLTLEPHISAGAVDVHPAVSFASVMFGAALFGVSGAFVAVPVAALLLALVEIYTHTYELLPELAQQQPGERPPEPADSPDAEEVGAPEVTAEVELDHSRVAAWLGRLRHREPRV